MRSPYPDITIPDVDLWSNIFERRELPYSPNKVLFHDINSPRSYTYSQLRATALKFGQSLRTAWNWHKGDVLAISSPNDIDYPPVVYGCLWAGGVVTTANPAYTVDELAGQLEDSGAKALVAHPACLKIALEAGKKVGLPQNRIILLGAGGGRQGLRHFTKIQGFSLFGGSNIPRPFKIDPDNDVALLVYSSGTTGKPKGVKLSHRNIVGNCFQIDEVWKSHLSGGFETGTGDRSIGFLPMFHIYGFACLVNWNTLKGMEIFVMPVFDLVKFLETVQKHKITYNFVIPKVILGLAKHPIVAKYDLSSLKMLASAAAPLTKDLVEMCHARLKIPIGQAYGMSETSPGTHVVPWEEWDQAIASIGRPIPNTEAKIVSIDSDIELGPNEEGELWVRGPQVFKGYHNNPSATANAVTSDGWYKTGDVAYVNEKGFFFITDRVKELIKYNGFQVAPAELEGLLLAHPQVEAAAVIGLFYEDIATEVPRAYIVPKKGVERNVENAQNIAKWLKEKTAYHKWLRGGVKFVDEIPISASGKILRRELKAIAEREPRGRTWKL